MYIFKELKEKTFKIYLIIHLKMIELSKDDLEHFTEIMLKEYPFLEKEDASLFLEDLYKFWEQYLFNN
jgi:hypothetical protein